MPQLGSQVLMARLIPGAVNYSRIEHLLSLCYLFNWAAKSLLPACDTRRQTDRQTEVGTLLAQGSEHKDGIINIR